MDEKTVLHSGLFLITCLLALTIASLATEDWKHDEEMSVGLWEICDKIECSSHSQSGFEVTGLLEAVRALLIISVIFQVISWLALFRNLNEPSLSQRLTTFCLAIAGCCTGLAMIIFTIGFQWKSPSDYGFSYILGWFSPILSYGVATFLTYYLRLHIRQNYEAM